MVPTKVLMNSTTNLDPELDLDLDNADHVDGIDKIDHGDADPDRTEPFDDINDEDGDTITLSTKVT